MDRVVAFLSHSIVLTKNRRAVRCFSTKQQRSELQESSNYQLATSSYQLACFFLFLLFFGTMNCLEESIDWGFVSTIFSCHEFLLNFDTRRKQLYSTLYGFGLMLLVCVFCEIRVDLQDNYHPQDLGQTGKNCFVLLAIAIYGTEPLAFFVQWFFLSVCLLYDDKKNLKKNGKTKEFPETRKPESMADVAVVIPYHVGADVLVITCQSLLCHVEADQIFVVHINVLLEPPYNTREVLAEADLHEVHYSKFSSVVQSGRQACMHAWLEHQSLNVLYIATLSSLQPISKPGTRPVRGGYRCQGFPVHSSHG